MWCCCRKSKPSLTRFGYDAKILGQKSYNGVAVLSRHKLKVTAEGLPGFTDEQARYLETELEAEGRKWRLASVYAPNGNPPYNDPDDDSRYAYKLRWFDALLARAEELLRLRVPVVLGGDFNVILSAAFTRSKTAIRSGTMPEARCRTIWACG